MATIGTPIYSNFIGSPITVPVTARNYANATFHRIRLTVAVNSATSYEFSAPVSSDALTVQFDISSALRAFAENHEYNATVLNQYPNLSASCVACSDYILNGEVHEGADPSAPTVISGLYAGKLTDLERLTGSRPARYSRKPDSSPEVVFFGGQYLRPGATVEGVTPSAPRVDVFPIDAQTIDQQNLYGIAQPKNGYEIRFINSLGVHENIFVKGFPDIKGGIQTERYVLSKQETLTKFSRSLAVKQNDHERWNMTSGPVDREWASWFVHEFLMVRWAWININGNYIPCHIIPEEEVTLRDGKTASPLEIPFIVELDITGSPLV